MRNFSVLYSEKAIEAVSKAIIIDPYIPLLYVRLGGIYKELGLEKEAIENWTKALFLDPTNEELQEELELQELYFHFSIYNSFYLII